MNFLYPLGLLGLIGIPILIIIYIIKSKYAEQTVASTYLWTLSERFLKRKKPVSPIAGIISLILQMLAVAAISLIIARPIITVPGSAKEYCFILDSSGSMNMQDDGATRFDRAKDKIESIVKSSTSGSRYTLVSVSDITTTVFDKLTDKKEALELISALKCGYVEAEYEDAIAVAQKIFDENRSAKTYLITDTSYSKTENIQLINVADGEKNVSLSNIAWKITGGKLTLTGNVMSHSENRTLTVSAYADGAEAALVSAEVTAQMGEPVQFKLEATLKTFASLRVSVNGGDSLACDDEYVIYNVKSEDNYSILLVSDTPFFLETALASIGHSKIEVVSPDDYSSNMDNYGLYIFDCCIPSELPDDGAVWFFDPQGSVPGSGFSVQGQVELSAGDLISKTTSTSSAAKTMINGVSGDEIYITEYVKCSMYRSFTTLFSYKGNPIVFAGTNTEGHREVVFAFDLHNSNLPLLVDFLVMTDNLMTFSFPDVLEKVNYFAGETAPVNVVANCDSIRVESPSGTINYLDTGMAVSDVSLSEVGTYKVTVTVSNIPRDYFIYSALPESESAPVNNADEMIIIGTAENGGFDGTYDPLTLLFIVLACVFLADWGVYCYEKYQLR